MNALFAGHSHKTLEELMGDVRIFDTHGADSQLNERSGQKVLILRELTPDECDVEEVGKMYHVRFSDGFECDAFEDELRYSH